MSVDIPPVIRNKLVKHCPKAGQIYSIQTYLFEFGRNLGDIPDNEDTKKMDVILASLLKKQNQFTSTLDNLLGNVCPDLNLPALREEAKSRAKDDSSSASDNVKKFCKTARVALVVSQKFCKVIKLVTSIPGLKLIPGIGNIIAVLNDVGRKCLALSEQLDIVVKRVCKRLGN